MDANSTAPPLVRAYFATKARRDLLVKLLIACFDGFWLGVQDRQALARLDEFFYQHGRDVLDGDWFAYTEEGHNLGGLRDWEAAAVEEHFPAGSQVIVDGGRCRPRGDRSARAGVRRRRLRAKCASRGRRRGALASPRVPREAPRGRA